MRFNLQSFALASAILLLFAEPCFSYGALAVGLHPNYNMPFLSSATNQPSDSDAKAQALATCQKSYRNCAIIASFVNACTFVFDGAQTHKKYVGFGTSRMEAFDAAARDCGREGNRLCNKVEPTPAWAEICDRTPSTSQTSLQASPSAQNIQSPATSFSSAPPSSGFSLGTIFSIIALFFIAAFGIPFLFYLTPTKSQVPEVPKPAVPPVQDQEPLASGSLMRATIEPLPDNVIRVIIQLSHEASAILDNQHIWERILFDLPNPIYEKQMLAYKEAWADYEDRKKSKIETVRWFAKEPIDPEPSKVIRVSVADFCNPQGYARVFQTAGEAKGWATELRSHIETLKNIIEQNKAPPQKETFNF